MIAVNKTKQQCLLWLKAKYIIANTINHPVEIENAIDEKYLLIEDTFHAEKKRPKLRVRIDLRAMKCAVLIDSSDKNHSKAVQSQRTIHWNNNLHQLNVLAMDAFFPTRSSIIGANFHSNHTSGTAWGSLSFLKSANYIRSHLSFRIFLIWHIRHSATIRWFIRTHLASETKFSTHEIAASEKKTKWREM